MKEAFGGINNYKWGIKVVINRVGTLILIIYSSFVRDYSMLFSKKTFLLDSYLFRQSEMKIGYKP